MPTLRHITLRRLLFTSAMSSSVLVDGGMRCSSDERELDRVVLRRRGAASAPARAPNARPSSSELLPSRFAPCRPEQLASPTAYKPGRLVRPIASASTPPIM